MENREESESGFVGEPDAGAYVGTEMRDVEVFRVAGSNVLARNSSRNPFSSHCRP